MQCPAAHQRDAGRPAGSAWPGTRCLLHYLPRQHFSTLLSNLIFLPGQRPCANAALPSAQLQPTRQRVLSCSSGSSSKAHCLYFCEHCRSTSRQPRASPVCAAAFNCLKRELNMLIPSASATLVMTWGPDRPSSGLGMATPHANRAVTALPASPTSCPPARRHHTL